jgi:hypothetical protein
MTSLHGKPSRHALGLDLQVSLLLKLTLEEADL